MTLSGGRGWRFRPRLVPSLVTVVVWSLLMGLGFWQLDRAQQKRELLSQFETQGGDAPIAVLGMATGYQGLDYQRATVRGRFDVRHQFLLDNRTYQGWAGYHVLTPLRIAGSERALLVNRGWVPLGRTRQDLPPLPLPETEVRLEGLLKHPPDKVFMLGEDPSPGPFWPRVIQRVQMDRLGQGLGYDLLPVMLLLAPESEHGFVRDWRPVTFGPERNVGYAVQWFSLAAALLVIYLLVNLKRIPRD